MAGPSAYRDPVKSSLIEARDLIRRSGEVPPGKLLEVDSLIASQEYLKAVMLLENVNDAMEKVGNSIPRVFEALDEARAYLGIQPANNETFASKHLERYRSLKLSGVGPEELGSIMKSEGIQRLERITYLRAVFGLSLNDAVGIDDYDGRDTRE